ncbi:hypothetical protein B566_EDAN003718 [Ephemera danica]|nr:hypothetical protein B566_EDAN003718 [Ephemera danica]
MNTDDIVYIVLLIFSIGIGFLFKKIEDKSTQQWFASVVGFILIFIVSGIHIIHPLLCITVTALIITFSDRRKCHLFTFGFLFSYLLFFRSTIYFGIPYPPAHTNLIQMFVTLKMVGLAFEVYDTSKAKRESPNSHEFLPEEPKLIDIFHYAFCYIGILTGPYYRYRTYWDLFHSPYADYADCKSATMKRLILAPIAAVLYLISSNVFPWDYGQSDAFLTECSLLYRVFYLIPCFFTFRMRLYTGMFLAECSCIMVGLGAYPASSQPRTGHGPAEYAKLKAIPEDKEQLKKQEYSFATVYNIDPWGVEFVPTLRLGMHCWNTTVQYWLAMYVYKRVPSKSLRTGLTMLTSAYWHGVCIGYYLCFGSVPFYVPMEDIYDKLYRIPASGLKRKIIDGIFLVTRHFAFAYMATAFIYLHVDKIFFFWRSIYFMGHVCTAVAYVIGLALLRANKPPRPKTGEPVKLE